MSGLKMEEKEIQHQFAADFALLIEAGFIAVKQCDEKGARHIFGAALALNPKSMAPRVGVGYIALNKMQLKESDQVFTKILEEEPENWLAMAFLGVSHVLQKGKRKDGVALLEKVLDHSKEPTVRNLADLTLKWVVKDLEKKESKAPFFPKKQEAS